MNARNISLASKFRPTFMIMLRIIERRDLLNVLEFLFLVFGIALIEQVNGPSANLEKSWCLKNTYHCHERNKEPES